MSLILHCGAAAIDRTSLAALPVPAPLGSRHVVRPFIEDVEIVQECLGDHGLQIRDEAFGVTKEGNRFFGVLEVAPAIEGEYIPKDYGVTVGLRGSYDQSMTRGLAVGSRVFVCDNLAFSGEITFKTKQTTFIAERLPRMIQEAVARIPVLAKHQAERFDLYKGLLLTKHQGDALITEFVRREIVNPSQVGKVISEWDNPSHGEHLNEDGERTVWTLHNAVTEAIKPANRDRLAIPSLWERTIPLTGFLDEIVRLH